MIDQLRIGDVYSYDSFFASLKEREIEAPKKKSIKETVPFSNKTYDFSKINGELYWEDRPLKYVFEIMADSPDLMEKLKSEFSSWVMNVQEEKLYDPFIEDYHFLATFDSISFDDDESLEKTTITVAFTAYPYKIANEETVYRFDTSGEDQTVKIKNNSAHRVIPTFTSTNAITIVFGNTTYSLGGVTEVGSVTDERIKLEMGVNEMIIQSSDSSAGILAVTFIEEVL